MSSNLETETPENLTHTDEDHDDDDDELNASHKIVPNIDQSSITKTTEENVEYSQINNSIFHVPSLIKEDPKQFVNISIPKYYSDFVHCSIKREKQGIQKGFSTIFSLYFDDPISNDQTFLLTARKQFTIGGHSQYFIGYDIQTLLKNANDENSIAKLKGINLTGSDYILYDHTNNIQKQRQLAAITYEGHIFGSNEPRKLIVILPLGENEVRQSEENETLIDRYRSGRTTDLIALNNRAAKYDQESKRFVLHFEQNRIRQASHKNFQLLFEDENHEEHVVMQFGRIDEVNFALDYRYPLSAMQAFAIALSSFHNRFRS